MQPRLDKAINGLKKACERYETHELLVFSPGQVMITPKPDKWGGRLLLSIILLVPIGIFIYSRVSHKADDASSAAIIWVFISAFLLKDFISQQKGQQNMSIDFEQQQFILEPIDRLLSLQKEPVTLDFASVKSATLKQKSFGRSVKVLRLSLHDIDNNVLTYIDLEDKYPKSFVAEKIRLLIELVLSTHNKEVLINANALPAQH